MAMLACLIANANRDEKKRREPYTVQDFMPYLERSAEGRRQTWQEQKAILMAMFPPKKSRGEMRD
jgi:hypothetical protein